jgi:predicted nucleic acid-binding protein
VSGSDSRLGRGILDTSTVISLPRITDPNVLPDEPLITTVTLAELTVGSLAAADPEERWRRQALLQQAEADFVPLPFDEAAARAFGAVAMTLRSTGRKRAARGVDAMIAAIAVANDLPIHTCNPRDFEDIDRLHVVPVAVPV